MHTHTHTHTCTCTCTHTHARTHARTHTHMHTHARTHTHTHMHTCTHTHMYTCTQTHTHAHTHTHACTFHTQGWKSETRMETTNNWPAKRGQSSLAPPENCVGSGRLIELEGTHGVGSHGVGTHGVGSHGVGSHGVRTSGVGGCVEWGLASPVRLLRTRGILHPSSLRPCSLLVTPLLGPSLSLPRTRPSTIKG